MKNKVKKVKQKGGTTKDKGKPKSVTKRSYKKGGMTAKYGKTVKPTMMKKGGTAKRKTTKK